ncbi:MULTISPECIES: hydroxymethylglutaryl-CoA synthase [Enterococcus]|uniref:Hydroxymethylglutaryl-CoA synthase n=2 Tax=root TaxID=1 RepID=A0A179ENY3_ENTTH|nr:MULTISPECIES: hydroxymethylglutaryl-CoA synthase [Enterococcus]ASZ07134.1 hydroxymethylglutaryl-CoA synthase [Enterococcus thailandicus]MDA3965491.1 hydroxymethylglutaryl-CoA synthase [Enterococcus thailandicus]MDK4352535.1 hydroxymethylglutaryl-CoA synthase [Enterococcus thailandicus]MDT2735134.1 hydroxymethylglutaryl-CoA synthase [Enterococcus thailandicus]MDT2847449.1 hydroxymethylglutaryl-CoA synthase [Enterococcus thailandicus]
MKIGIDRLSFFIPNLYLDMTELAESRGDDPAKYHIGIGQDQMAVNRATEDIITLGANAASKLVTAEDREQIDMVIVGTESGVDHSKASAVIIHHLLKIQPFARSFEVKEACYGGTAALHMAKEYVRNHPERKVLVIASDIARYGLATGGEVTQGVGAVAMMVTANPRILSIENDSVFLTEDIYDFWRPDYSEFPVVDGPLSNATYIEAFQKVWQQHKKQTGLTLEDYPALCFHIPYTKMGKKALQSVLDETDEANQSRLLTRYDESIQYSRRVGNLYTGSLYLGLISLLENSSALQAGDRVGLFSYGSGAVSEFFTGILEENYQDFLDKEDHQALFDNRQQVSVVEYEQIFSETLPEHGQHAAYNSDVPFSIYKVENDIRYYKEAE